jgi:hypothetical protein
MVHPGSVPPRLSAIVGDVLQNARAALDCAVFAVATATAPRPLTESEKRDLGFPVVDRPSKFDAAVSAGRQLRYVPQSAVDIIRTRQPFCNAVMLDMREGSTEWNEVIKSDPLWVLTRLSNIDKHRSLHLGAWIPQDVHAATPDGVTVHWRWGRAPWGEGDEVGRWTIMEGDPSVKLEHGGKVDLALVEDLKRGWLDVPACDRLRSLVDWVGNWVLPPLGAI